MRKFGSWEMVIDKYQGRGVQIIAKMIGLIRGRYGRPGTFAPRPIVGIVGFCGCDLSDLGARATRLPIPTIAE